MRRKLVVSVVALSGPVLAATLQRKIEHPEFNWKNAVINVILTPFRYFRVGPFERDITVENIQKTAQEESKLTDFGDTGDFRALEAFLQTDIHKAQILSNFGYLTCFGEMQSIFMNHLKVIQAHKDYPEAKKIAISKPVFVTGLFRSGTTYLHRLLALDPNSRSPLLWELGRPAPSVITSDLALHSSDREARRKVYIQNLQIGRDIGGWDLFDQLHEVNADLPEECQVSFSGIAPFFAPFQYLMYTTPSPSAPAIFSLPISSGYRHYKMVLQLLDLQTPTPQGGTRWLLKGPLHLHYLPELAAAFPDSQLIWIHRDPAQSIPSLCSMVSLLHHMVCEKAGLDPSLLGQGVLNTTIQLLTQAPAALSSSGLPCCHVQYDDLIHHPMETIRSIYAYYGWAYTPEYDALLRAYIEESQAKRKTLKEKQSQGQSEANSSGHNYDLKQFGLHESAVLDPDNSSGPLWGYYNAYLSKKKKEQ